MSTPDAPDALDELLDSKRHDQGCSAEHGEHYRCRCIANEMREAARAIVAALRERAGAVERLEAWMRAGNERYVYDMFLEAKGWRVLLVDNATGEEPGSEPCESLALAITQALDQAERPVGGKETT